MIKTEKKRLYSIRLSANDMEMLNFLHKKTGKTKSEILRNGLRMQYNLEKFKEN